MLNADQAREHIPHIAGHFAKGDHKKAAMIAYDLGRAAGREDAANKLCHFAREIEKLNGKTDETATMRHVARELCEWADEIAVGYLPPGRAAPTREERYIYRAWLDE